MEIQLNPLVDKYLVDGCMRCQYGATPQCKVLKWIPELETLRQLVLESGLKEEIKWGVPVYTHQGKNVVNVSALKDSANIGFFKGVLLKDSYQILMKQGNLQSDRLVRFTDVSEIQKLEKVLKTYIAEAIEIEERGEKVEFNKNPEPMPEELIAALEADQAFKKAFYALTPGRQRGYIIYFSQPKQSQTRMSRIEKHRQMILDGVGLHDKYSG